MNKNFWEKRRLMLEAIKEYGREQPLSVWSRNIVAHGTSLIMIMKFLTDGGYVEKFNVGRRVVTKLTNKGERLLEILNDLKAVIDEN